MLHRRAVAPPPTRYGAGVQAKAPVQAKLQPIAGRRPGVPPPATQFGGPPAQAKPEAKRAGTPPPPVRYGPPSLQPKITPAARPRLMPPPASRTIQRASTSSSSFSSGGGAATAPPTVVGLAGRSIADYKLVYNPGLFSSKRPGQLLAAIQQDFNIGAGTVRVLDQTAWAAEYSKVYGRPINVSGKLGGTVADADGRPIIFISTTVIERALGANSIAEIVSTMRHEYQHALQMLAGQLIYHNVDLKEFEAHYLELIQYAEARSHLVNVRLAWGMRLAGGNATGFMTDTQTATVYAMRSALAADEGSLGTALRNAMAHYDNMPADYRNAHARAGEILNRIVEVAYRREPADERVSVGDAIAYTIDDPDIAGFYAKCQQLRTQGLR